VFSTTPVRFCAALTLLCGFVPGTSQAEKPSETPIPNCLDQSITDELGQTLRPRGVQSRDFLKRGQVELVARGGLFAADLLSTSYMAGGAVGFYVTEDLGLEVSLDITPIALDLDEPLAEFFGDDRFEPGLGYLAMSGLLWSPIHAKLRMGDSIVHSDIVFSAGGGKLLHDSVQGFAGQAGAALEMYATQWVTLRFDLRNVILLQEAVAETRITNNLIATFGLALWIPTGL
jgi:outer membrane beta-barrel protein